MKYYIIYIMLITQKYLLWWFIRIYKIQMDKLEIGEKDNKKIQGQQVLCETSSM